MIHPAPLNSPDEVAPKPSLPQVKPASEPQAEEAISSGAGISQSSVAQIPAAEERSTPEPRAPALHGSGGLPEGWELDYARALSEATATRYLKGAASKYWNGFGGWAAHKSGPNAATAVAIYDAFANHFGDAGKEARETILHELGALA